MIMTHFNLKSVSVICKCGCTSLLPNRPQPAQISDYVSQKSLKQDFIRRTLVSASHSIGLKWFMKYHSTATIIIPAKIDWFPNQLKLNPSWRCQFFFNSENSYHIHRGWIWFSMGIIYLLCLVLTSSSVFPYHTI